VPLATLDSAHFLNMLKQLSIRFSMSRSFQIPCQLPRRPTHGNAAPAAAGLERGRARRVPILGKQVPAALRSLADAERRENLAK
jgi:hypothetical protein